MRVDHYSYCLLNVECMCMCVCVRVCGGAIIRLYRAIGYIEDNREELNLDINSLVICGGVAANQELRR